MDNAILNIIAKDINCIKWILAGLLILYILVVISRLLFLKEKKQSDDFSASTRGLLDKNDFDGVIKKSMLRLQKYPGDYLCHWFLGLAYYGKKDWQKAFDEFQIVSEARPDWRAEYTDAHLVDLKDKLAVPKQ